ncbi:MAG: hypothetical protein B7Z80_15700 [Rhodospirillales bacterium 20-64-7]|nr:MAG: hypothetical protein B7Z80_15700 [Rhodospirillales bacterium 20-64-7]
MPEVIFTLRWPDGSETANYSPSSVVQSFFSAGEVLALEDFLQRARCAMAQASDRVRQKYGMPCARAAATLAELEARGQAFIDRPGARITVLALT